MAKDHFSKTCQNCGGELHITRMECGACGLAVEGNLKLPRLARLSAENREFIELFLLSAGSLKEVGKILELSYPTVRNRLYRVIAHLRDLDRDRRTERLKIIHELEGGGITAEEAARRLAEIS